MASLLEKIQKSCSALSKTLGSMCKIIILSRKESISGSQQNTGPELVVLGNGPSLRSFLDSGSHFLAGKKKMTVNFSSTSADYESLKPEYYLLMDPAFFHDSTTLEKVFHPMQEKTSWPMTLFVPFFARKNREWQRIIAANKNIKTYFFNSTPIEGYKTFRRMCYKLNIGMPRPRNVLVACLMVALKLPFKTIYLAGADHSWLKEIWVDDNNVVQELLRQRRQDNQSDLEKQNLCTARKHVDSLQVIPGSGRLLKRNKQENLQHNRRLIYRRI